MKTKSWKWLLVILVLIISAYRLKIGLENRPIQAEIHPFPLMQQPDSVTCGPTSAAMVLEYYGSPTSVEEISKTAKTHIYVDDEAEIGGTTPEYLQFALEEFGLPCRSVRTDLETLRLAISREKPPIVLVRSGKYCWHWMVAVGYGPDYFTFADPGSGQREQIPTSTFEKAWSFETDLDGEDRRTKCPVCLGSGEFLGPCDLCSGTGYLPDFARALVELGEARGNTAIIPLNSPTRE